MFNVYTDEASFLAVEISKQGDVIKFQSSDGEERKFPISKMKAILFNDYQDLIIEQLAEIGRLRLELERLRLETIPEQPG